MKSSLLHRILLACGLAVSASAASAAMVTQDFGLFEVTYDDSTIFGGISFSFGGGSEVGFGWNIPDTVVVSNSDAGTTSAMFDLPDFTITATNGVLSGDIGAFIGNLVFTEVAGASTSASISASASIDGSPALPAGDDLNQAVTLDIPGVLTTGYYSLTGQAAYGSFSTLSVTDAVLTLSAGGGVAAITGQPQNQFKVYFNAVPVPEPETYAMLVAGLGLLAWRTRQTRV